MGKKFVILLLFLPGLMIGSVMLYAEESHEHRARHGGILVGLEYAGAEVAHAELAVDPAQGTAAAYFLDASGTNTVRIPQETLDLQMYLPSDPAPIVLTMTARANPQTGEISGDTSEFIVQSDRLKGAGDFKATVGSVFVSGYEVTDINFSFPEGSS